MDFLSRVDGREGRDVEVEVGGVKLTEAIDVVGVERLEIIVEFLPDVDRHLFSLVERRTDRERRGRTVADVT